MTPKEKANQLFNTYYNRVGMFSIDAKKSALIAVEEIETVLLQERVFESLDYWKEVKKEINKL